MQTVVSLPTPEEEVDLDIVQEACRVQAHGLWFVSFPIPDRHVPQSARTLADALEPLADELAEGRNLVVHCRQGIGRTGLVAACLLLTQGVDPETAVKRLSQARGTAVLETPEQRQWIDRYATVVANLHHA